ncbi:nuclear apoptosis-inducing factor 1-like [Ambystoma mexicanum]|uniref:nuclear apoptosis-inducing factor 1-like n=1 Tax=Ambystoma mexicanum TaxID=8296 RepID=UPI0037E81A27
MAIVYNMSRATRKTTPRLRKKRFSDEELNMLADTLAAHADEVFTNNLKREAQMREKEIWAEVARKVSAVGTTPRTVNVCKKRWDDLSLRVQNILAINRREAMATGGDAHSPVRLMRCEETCSTIIQMESIEGFGEMETGAATSGEGGIDGEGGSQDPSTRPSTSRARPPATGQSTSGAALRPTVQSRASAQAMQAHEDTTAVDVTATTELPTTVEGEADGTQSTATSSVGEAAATTPLSDIELGAEEYVDLEGTIHVECPHTPSPLSTPQDYIQATLTSSILDPAVLLHSSDLSTTPEASHAMAHPAAAPPTSAAPTDLEARLSRVEARQDSMIDLVRQYVSDGEETQREICQAIAGNTAAINACAVMIRDSLGAVTQVLTSMLQHMQHQQTARAVPIPPASSQSSTSASSTPFSPVRMTRRSARQTEMLPPDTKKASK